MAYAPRPIAERFWEKVDKTGDCWIFTGSKTRGGYGNFVMKKGVLRRAHRVAWELTHGEVPEGQWVLHHCDNPPCVRPDHLFLGTHVDNMADMRAKDRGAKGPRPGTGLAGDLNPSRLHPERRARGDRHGSRTHPERFRGQSTPGESNGRAMLTWVIVEEIRAAYAAGASSPELAVRYGVNRGQIWRIVTGRAWKQPH